MSRPVGCQAQISLSFTQTAVASVLWADEVVVVDSFSADRRSEIPRGPPDNGGAAEPAHDVYLVPRRSYMMGRWIKGSGWYPNFRQPQLFRKGAMRYTLEPVHEGYENLSGKPVGELKNAIWQFPFRNLEEVIKKMNRYSSLGVPKLAGKRVSMASALGHGLWSFLKHYIFKRGFIDGWAGFVIAFGNFEGTFYRYAKRYEEARNWQPPKSEPLKRSV